MPGRTLTVKQFRDYQLFVKKLIDRFFEIDNETGSEINLEVRELMDDWLTPEHPLAVSWYQR